MSNQKQIVNLKSVNIRSTDIKRKLLMSSGHVSLLQAFLKKTIGEEVVVINTNVGTEIYYTSIKNFSDFIKNSFLLYTLKDIDSKKIKFKHTEDPMAVENNFKNALLTFAKYPQLFLAYTKKFVFLCKKNSSSRIVMPTLNTFFKKTLDILVQTKQLPIDSRIINNYENVITKTDTEIIWQNLITEIISEKHIN